MRKRNVQHGLLRFNRVVFRKEFSPTFIRLSLGKATLKRG